MPPSPDNSRLRIVPIFLSQFFGVACGIAGVRFNSLLIAPAVLGVYGVFLTFAPLGAWIVHAGLVKFVARHWQGAENRASLGREIFWAWARRLRWLALATGAAAFVMGRMSSGGAALLWFALFAAAGLLSLTALLQTALQAERAHWRDCAVTVCGSVLRTFAPSLLYAATGGVLAALWFGFLGHALITVAVGAWAMRRYFAVPANSPRTSMLTSVYDGPLFNALAIAAWVLAGANRWIITWRFGETEGGYFTLAGGAAVVVASTVGTVFIQYFQPGFFALGDSTASDRAALARRVDQVALAYALTAVAAIGAFQFVSPWLVGPLINPNYRAALSWILPGGAFTIATATGLFYHTMLLAGRRERACGSVDLVTASVLAAGCVVSATCGHDWFVRWLLFTPLVPWLLTRPLARWYFFQPDSSAA